jgi:hypothetical protein
MTEPRPQKFELYIAEFGGLKCRVCDCDVKKGEYFVVELPSYYHICRKCVKTLYVFLQDNQSTLLTM